MAENVFVDYINPVRIVDLHFLRRSCLPAEDAGQVLQIKIKMEEKSVISH